MKRRLIPLLVLVVAMIAGYFYFRKNASSSLTSSKELRIYIWTNYMDPEVYKLFEQNTGVRIVEEILDTNEGLENKLKAGVTGYDLIVPSGYAVQRFARQNLLATLDHERIPNLKNVSGQFKSPFFDPELKYCVPYLWGTSGIGYNVKLSQKAPTSWADLFEPDRIRHLNKKISMLDDPREAIGAALKYKGFSVNTVNPQELAIAKEILRKQKPFVARFDNDTYGNFLLTGDLGMALGYSGDVLKQQKNSKDIGYVIPQEGAIMWTDNLAIPASTSPEQKKLAEDFINFVLSPEINARIVNVVNYPSTVDAAKQFISPELVQNPNIYPPEDVIKRLEWMSDLESGADLYEKVWEEVRAE